MIWSLTPFAGRVPSRGEAEPFAVLQREMNRLFDDTWRGRALTETPLRLDVKEDDKAFHITADLPGLSEKDVELTFEDGTLTIRGEKKVARDEKTETWHMVERFSGAFARQVVLPASIDAEHIDAAFDKGVLTVTLPKMPEEQAKAKKIEIKSGH